MELSEPCIFDRHFPVAAKILLKIDRALEADQIQNIAQRVQFYLRTFRLKGQPSATQDRPPRVIFMLGYRNRGVQEAIAIYRDAPNARKREMVTCNQKVFIGGFRE